MDVFVENGKRLAKRNENFRQVIYTGPHSQLVLMSLRPGEDIGEEVHEVDQVLYFVDGEGEVVADGKTRAAEEHSIIFVPSGARHNVVNSGEEALKLFTIYSPPGHPRDTVHRTKAEAAAPAR